MTARRTDCRGHHVPMYLDYLPLCDNDNPVAGEKIPYRVQGLHLLLKNSLGVFTE